MISIQNLILGTQPIDLILRNSQWIYVYFLRSSGRGSTDSIELAPDSLTLIHDSRRFTGSEAVKALKMILLEKDSKTRTELISGSLNINIGEQWNAWIINDAVIQI